MTARPRTVSAKARESLTAHAAYAGPQVTITTQIAPAAWRDVKAILEALDAVYVVGTSGFRFPADVDAEETVTAALRAGKVMGAAGAAGFVATPAGLAEELVEELAELRSSDARLRVLEPSAGTGRLVAAVLDCRPYRVEVVAVEMDGRRAGLIPSDDRVTVVTGSIEDHADTLGQYDRIVMNPPFSVPGKPTLWASHLLLAWQLLAPGGRLLAILPYSVLRDSPAGADAKAVAALIRDNGGAYALEPDAFAVSGASVTTAAVWLDRPPAAAAAGPAAVIRPILTRAAAAAVPVQCWTDQWRGRDRVLRFAGDCVVCDAPTWAFDDGENDPRGILGDASAGFSLEAADYDKTGPMICLCVMCGNDGDAWRKAREIAETRWHSEPVHLPEPAPEPAPEPVPVMTLPRPAAAEQLVLL